MTPDQGLALAKGLIVAPTAVLAWTDEDGPNISRIGTAWVKGGLYALLSDLSPHTSALKSRPNCALMFGDAPHKGDPLNHPRLSLKATAHLGDKAENRTAFLSQRAKSKLYYDFADFHLFRFEITRAFLNGGFGKALNLDPATF